MPTWLSITLLSLAALSVLDATIGRWALAQTTRTFERNPTTGLKPTSWNPGRERHLLVYLPGTLADGVDSIAEIEDTFKKPFSRVMRVSYGLWRYLPAEIIGGIVRNIGARGRYYDKLTFVGSSMGGLSTIQVIEGLREEYGWQSSDIKVIFVDTPPSPAYFAEPGRTTSRILRWVYAGPLLSLLVDPIMALVTVPPKDENIERQLDAEEVKRTAKARMAKFHFSAICDQQRYLMTAPARLNWSALKGIHVVYMACRLNNETVVQPDAAIEFERLTRPYVASFAEAPVDSTHCGYLERPLTWEEAFTKAFDQLAIGR